MTDRGWGTGRAVAAGTAGAVFAVLLLLVWDRIQHWLIWRSAYTDLPGQDTHHLVAVTLGSYVGLGLIAVVVGRVSGLLCRSSRWLAALLSVLPVIALILVSPRQFWFWYICAPPLALGGAYARRHGP